MPDKYGEVAAVESFPADMTACMDKFSRTFEASARRWEMVVYPSLLAFIVLAAYGFFLIYTLTGDVARLAVSMERVVESMHEVSVNMHAVANNVARISGNLSTIAVDVDTGTDDMGDLLVKMDNINTTVGYLAVPMYDIRNSMGRINNTMHEATGPMQLMGGLFPF